jgi:hypothetical protein
VYSQEILILRFARNFYEQWGGEEKGREMGRVLMIDYVTNHAKHDAEEMLRKLLSCEFVHAFLWFVGSLLIHLGLWLCLCLESTA